MSESRAEKVASSILAETFVLFLKRVFLFLCVLAGKIFGWTNGWMDG